MARYKNIDTSPRFLAVDLERQLLPGTFEHALNYLIDRELDLSSLDVRYRNDANPSDRRGAKGSVRKSNRTDIDSAKMATAKGVIQGYTGVAAVDDRHQIIVEAQAHGTGSEQELLLPVVAATATMRAPHTPVTADAGYHSETNLKALAAQDIPALIADNGMRKRDFCVKVAVKWVFLQLQRRSSGRAADRRSVPCNAGLARRLASRQAGCILEPLWCHYGWRTLCLPR
jgi:hypothetical protein